MPSSPSGLPDLGRHAWLTAQPYAHRGLHGGRICENSRSAFQAAVDAGVGIELDVRLSRDGFAVVFHDASLERLTRATGLTGALSADELGYLRLGQGGDRIEALPAILALVAARAPLLIELKTDGDPRIAARLSLSVRHALEGYRGQAAVMSFDPRVCQWFANHASRIARGLVVSETRRRGVAGMLKRHLSLRRARPHFVACDVRTLPCLSAARARRRGVPVLAWTVRADAEHAIASAHADQIIFER